MTLGEFEAFYPQFANFQPLVVAEEYLAQANARFGDFGLDMNEARRLYLAHKLTLYCFTRLPDGETATSIAIARAGKGQSNVGEKYVSAKKVDQVEVHYAYSDGSSLMSAKANTAFADLTETEYGLQLLTLIRQHQIRKYVP